MPPAKGGRAPASSRYTPAAAWTRVNETNPKRGRSCRSWDANRPQPGILRGVAGANGVTARGDRAGQQHDVRRPGRRWSRRAGTFRGRDGGEALRPASRFRSSRSATATAWATSPRSARNSTPPRDGIAHREKSPSRGRPSPVVVCRRPPRTMPATRSRGAAAVRAGARAPAAPTEGSDADGWSAEALTKLLKRATRLAFIYCELAMDVPHGHQAGAGVQALRRCWYSVRIATKAARQIARVEAAGSCSTRRWLFWENRPPQPARRSR